MILVMRLDGPTKEDAKALVDRAIRANVNGVSGRGYFDQYGSSVDKDPNKSIKKAYDLFKNAGFVCQIEQTSSLMLPPDYSGEDALFYFGWYDGGQHYLTNGDHFQWQDGSIGVNLYSGGADVLDLRHETWCPWMIVRGVAGTQASISEGYTFAYSNAYYLLLYMLNGFSYAEACYASNIVLSWKQVFLGDPLLRWPTGSLPNPPISEMSINQNGHTTIKWNTIFGRSYIVEYSDGNADGNLTSDSVFIPIPRSLVTENFNPGNGESFVDDYSDPPAPVTGKRYYRIKVVDIE